MGSSDQVPHPGQNIYTDPSYQNLFSNVDRYGATSWDAQLNQHPGPSTQTWHNGTFAAQLSFNALSQSYGAQPNSLRTASPYQYGQFSQQGAIPTYGSPSNVDPSLGMDPNAIRQQQQSPYPMPMRNGTPQNHSVTVTPQALQHNVASLQSSRPPASPFQIPKSTADLFAQQRVISAPAVKPVRVPEYEIPKGRRSGGLYVLDQIALAKATKSNALNKFVTFGSEPFHLATNRTALPLYTPRLSLKEAKKAGAVNKKLARLSSSKSSKALQHEKRYARPLPGLKPEVSDSESYTESSSDYSDSSDDEEVEVSPLPASRSEEPHAAVRYDTIKATWYPHTSSPNPDQIKNSMRDIWEVLGTIQKRWRTDTAAVTEAEAQKKIGELPVLKSRVASQRELFLTALKSALEHAHPDVLYYLGQIQPFLYSCYQFLANRARVEDYDGPLSAAIYEILSRCGFLTRESLEETKVIKALNLMRKHANEKHKGFIKLVIDGALTNSKKAKPSSPPKTDSVEAKGVKRPAADTGRAVNDGPTVKRPKAADSIASTVKKDGAAITGSKTTLSQSGSAVQKRPGEKPTAASAPVKSRVSQVANKPSGLFASLHAASKKPVTAPATTKSTAASKNPAVAAKEKKATPSTTSKPAFSFAQTMASLLKPKEQEAAPAKAEKQLPPETAEEKTKRLRKESRRHLRVTFRPDASLVDIRYFSHAPEEDMGHEENLVRDAGDIGGEGRMFKQHKELDVDEDEDDDDQQPWKEPTQVDFSVVKAEERQRNYMPYGGGQNQPSCPEKEANIRRENATLIIIYSHPSDLPSTPREPVEEFAPATTAVNFGTPPDLCLQRCPQSSVPKPTPDFSGLENIFKQFANPAPQQALVTTPPAPVQAAYVPPPALPAGTADLAAILSTLNGHNAIQPPPAPVAVPAPIQQAPPPPPMPAGLDFNALMAMMQAQAASGAPLPPPPPGLPPGFPPFPFAFPAQPQQLEAPAYQPQQHDSGAYQTQMQSQYDQQGNGGTKRQRDEGNNAAGAQGKRPKNRGERPHKVLACKFYQKGTCNKGDNCTYIHDT